MLYLCIIYLPVLLSPLLNEHLMEFAHQQRSYHIKVAKRIIQEIPHLKVLQLLEFEYVENIIKI